MKDKPLTKLQAKVIPAFLAGASRTEAYLSGNPIAKRWKPETLESVVDDFFDSDRVKVSLKAASADSNKSSKKERQTVQDKERTLTKKQAQFCKEYLVDLNGKQAAIRAGYSQKTAEQQASRLLSKAKVQIAIQKGMDERSERLKVTADDVIQELKVMAFVELDEGGIIKPSDKIRSLELLGKHLKMFTDKLEHTGKEGGPIETITSDMTPERASQIYHESLRKD